MTRPQPYLPSDSGSAQNCPAPDSGSTSELTDSRASSRSFPKSPSLVRFAADRNYLARLIAALELSAQRRRPPGRAAFEQRAAFGSPHAPAGWASVPD